MPELPDVEVFRRYFDKTSLNKKIKSIDIPDKKTLKDIKPSVFIDKVTGNKFTSSLRHGKYLFCLLEKPESVVMHFGMTGFLSFYKDQKDTSKTIRLIFNFQDSSHLGFDCRRRFGKVTYTPDYETFISEKELGKDPINDKITLQKFTSMIEGRKVNIKVFLMDQSILAGIGNIYSDEILFHSDLSPKRSVDSLKENEIKELHTNMKNILLSAIKYTEKDQFPDDYLLHFRKEGKDCPRCSGKIKFSTIGGRSSYYCSKHQK